MKELKNKINILKEQKKLLIEKIGKHDEEISI